MASKNATRPANPAAAPAARVFTVDSANKSLVLVRRVVRDITAGYEEFMRLRSEAEQTAQSANTREKMERLQSQIEDKAARLQQLQDELNAVGCELKDWARGLVDFPAQHDGRKVCLCWTPEENAIEFWHEWNAGYAGRQKIESDFGAAASESA